MSSRPKTLLGIILANLVPLLGVLIAGWDWREIIIFYWLGNISIAVLVILSTLRVNSVAEILASFGKAGASKLTAPAGETNPLAIRANWLPAVKAALIAFFCTHFGLFTLIHGVFVFAITSGNLTVSGAQPMPTDLSPVNLTQVIMFWIIGFITQITFWYAEGKQSVSIQSAYVRIIPLHLTLIIGTMLIATFNWPTIAAVLLVCTSFAFELVQHKSPEASAATDLTAARKNV